MYLLTKNNFFQNVKKLPYGNDEVLRLTEHSGQSRTTIQNVEDGKWRIREIKMGKLTVFLYCHLVEETKFSLRIF